MVDVPAPAAALGTTVTVETLDGDEDVEVPAGTQPGTVVELRGRGRPSLGRRGDCDQLNVVIPRNLSARQRELLNELAGSITGENLRVDADESIFSKVRRAFRGPALVGVSRWCYTCCVTTTYRRLGVSRDPELDRALAQTQRLLRAEETRSAAAQVRALALRGAESLLETEDDPAAEVRRRLYEDFEVIPATADPRTFRAPEGEVDPNDPTPASDALRWVRGKE